MSGYWRHLAAQAQARSASALNPARPSAPAWTSPGEGEPSAAGPVGLRAVPELLGGGPAAVVDDVREARGVGRAEGPPGSVAARADSPPSPGAARPSRFSRPQPGHARERASAPDREIASSRTPDERRIVPGASLPPVPHPRSGRTDAARARPAAAAAARASEGGDGSRTAAVPAVPDVHIHIGRVELTALAAPAPAPAHSRAPAAGRTLSLDDYLHGKHRR